MIEEQQAFLAKQKLWKEQDAEELMKKHNLLSMLDRQAEHWLTPNNIDEKINVELNNIFPPVILSHVDYYNKINKYAILLEQGNNQEAEELRQNRKVIDWKNKELGPLYNELKTIIKHMTYNEENSVFELYNQTVNRLNVNFEGMSQIEPIIEHFTALFKQLITLIRLEQEEASVKMETIESQLSSIIMILVIWSRYTDIIYMPDSEVERILNPPENDRKIEDMTLEEIMDKGDAVAKKQYYFSKITEKKTKGKGLFLTEFKDFYDVPKLREKIEDTAEALDEEYTTYDSDIDDSEVSKRKEKDRKSKEKSRLLSSEAKPKKESNKSKLKIGVDKRKLLETEVEEIFDEKKEEPVAKDTFGGKDSIIDNDIRDETKVEAKPKRDYLAEYVLRNVKDEIRSKHS
jgi:hypothetical protein